MHLFAILFLVVIHSCFGGKDVCKTIFLENGTPFLKFRQVESAVHRNGSFSYLGTDEPIIVDGMFPHMTIQIVELINNVPPKLEFHCVVDKLSKDSPISLAQLCFEVRSYSFLIFADSIFSKIKL